MLLDNPEKVASAAQRREATRYLISRYGVSERRACQSVRLSRSVFQSGSRRAPDDALRRRIRELAESRLRYDYKRIYILQRRDGLQINHKRAYRLYCAESLQLGAKRPGRNAPVVSRQTSNYLTSITLSDRRQSTEGDTTMSPAAVGG
ncbi:MAG: transposase [Spiribacter salinus]|uniref:Transposase n=1 Tax=Spiribacter salinus TaxID=1335746 RepID=A0A540VQK0_9GAMM|nr:MAG: transposase [Spiribacter salinus]